MIGRSERNLNFLIGLATIAMVSEDKMTTEGEPKVSMKSGIQKQLPVWPNNRNGGRHQRALCPHISSALNVKRFFLMKCNKVYVARLVAYGYIQVPGIDYSKNYWPVVNDIMFWVLL